MVNFINTWYATYAVHKVYGMFYGFMTTLGHILVKAQHTDTILSRKIMSSSSHGSTMLTGIV